MNRIWHAASIGTKFALLAVVAGGACGTFFLWVTLETAGFTGKPPAPLMVATLGGLLAVISFRAAQFIWANSVLPGMFLSMCVATRERGVEDVFVDECHPEPGDGIRQIAHRAGVRGLLQAFEKAQTHTAKK